MATLTEIQKEIQRLNDRLLGIDDRLVRQLDRYQSQYERLLRKQRFNLDEDGNLIRSVKNFNRAQSLNPSKFLAFNKLAIDYIKVYKPVGANQLKFNQRIGIAASMNFKDITIIKQLQKIDLATLIGESNDLDLLVQRALVNSIALGVNYQDAVDDIVQRSLGDFGEKAGKLPGFAATTMRTALFGLSRAIDKEIYDREDIQNFIYTGPIRDARIRPFCIARVGDVFTREEIEQFSVLNGSGLDGFLSPGGFNCRHRMIPFDALNPISQERLDPTLAA